MEKLKSANDSLHQKPAESMCRILYRRLLHQVIDYTRTAPFGMSLVGMGIFDGLMASQANDHSATAMAFLGIAGGIAAMKRQYQLRRRLEHICEKRGYSDRAFQLTTKEWCDRQTARIVAEEYGQLYEYDDLCERYKGSSNFTKLSHF